MEEQFVLILESSLRYNRGSVYEILGAGAISAVIAILVFFKYKKKRKSDRNAIGFVILIIALALIAFIFQYNYTTDAIHADIEEKDFVYYRGEFIHDNYQKDSFYHNIYITDDYGCRARLSYPDYGNMYKTYSNFTQLPIGSSTGTLVYSKRSKIVVFWEIDKQQE